MDPHKNIVRQVQGFVTAYLKENLSPQLLFHNFHHTQEVVLAALEIATHSNVSVEQIEIIEIAAWFHDCGYSTLYNGHEDLSKEIAEKFLKENKYSENLVKGVLSCIDATRFPQHPVSLESMILCDADLYHFTKPNYPWYEKALRHEMEL